jgi:prepilin-type N-terminal cleavage/methylation domain-containing protein
MNATMGATRGAQRGFTLMEVAIAAAIAALVMGGMFKAYNLVGRRVQFSACNLAANNSAMRQLEQVISANWVPASGITNLLTLSATNGGNLDLPSAQGNTINCTNVVSVSQISTNPPYAMVQVSCIWTCPSYGGVFTNTVAVLRAPNE